MAEFTSPGGFVFGVQGWTWGDPKPTCITFFIDGTTRVCDQHGRPIRGSVLDGKEVLFNGPHADVVAALAKERVDWRTLTCAGWPQLPYEQLKEAYKDTSELPPTPIDELKKIRDPELRRAALRLRREADEAAAKELQAADVEE